MVPKAHSSQVRWITGTSSSGAATNRRRSEQLIVRMADENRSWGYDRIVGALANLGHEISDQTVGNVPRRHGLPSAPACLKRATFGSRRAHSIISSERTNEMGRLPVDY